MEWEWSVDGVSFLLFAPFLGPASDPEGSQVSPCIAEALRVVHVLRSHGNCGCSRQGGSEVEHIGELLIMDLLKKYGQIGPINLSRLVVTLKRKRTARLGRM